MPLPSLSDLELTTLTRGKRAESNNDTDDVPSYWTAQLRWRTKSLPVHSYNHTLRAGLTNRLLEAGHLSFIHATTHQITWNATRKSQRCFKNSQIFRTKYSVASICSNKRHKCEGFVGEKKKAPSPLNWLQHKIHSYSVNTNSFACTNHLLSFTVLYIFIVLNAYI